MSFSVDYEKIEEKYKDLQGQSFWKPGDGENLIRIMPPYNEIGEWFKETFFHFEIGPTKKHLPCRKAFGSDCFICKVADAVRTSNPDLTKKLYRRRRFYMNVVDLNAPGKGVQVFVCGPTLCRDIISYVRDRRRYGEVLDPDKGKNIVIERFGQGRESRYIVKIEPDSTPITNKKWLDGLYNLDEIVRMPSEEEVKEALPSSYVKNPDLLAESESYDRKAPSLPPSVPSSGSGVPPKVDALSSISKQLEDLLGGD